MNELIHHPKFRFTEGMLVRVMGKGKLEPQRIMGRKVLAHYNSIRMTEPSLELVLDDWATIGCLIGLTGAVKGQLAASLVAGLLKQFGPIEAPTDDDPKAGAA